MIVKILIVLGWIVSLCLSWYAAFVNGKRKEVRKLKRMLDVVERNLLREFERDRSVISNDGVTFGQIPKEMIQGAGHAVELLRKMFDKEWKETLKPKLK
jgi:hypothetical protein